MIQEVDSNALKTIYPYKFFSGYMGLAIVGGSLASQGLANSWVSYLSEAYRGLRAVKTPVSLYGVPCGPK